MKKYIVLLIVMLFVGCDSESIRDPSTQKDDPSSPDNFLGYQPIDPIPVDKVMRYDESTGEVEEVYWNAIADESTVRELLPLHSARVSVSKNDISGSVSYLTAAVSGEKGSYTVIMDYMKYRVEDVSDEDSSEMIGRARIGIGLRITAVVETCQASLNIGSLLAIGLEAQRGNLRGGLSVDVIGIDSEAVTNLIPLTSEIDQTAIQAALQALASIKTKIFESETKLTPHLVAIKQAQKGMSQRIKDKVTTPFKTGVILAQLRKIQEEMILCSIAPNGIFDETGWDALVDRSTLPDGQKTQLKALDTLESIRERLDLDAGMRGTMISALHKAL